MIKKYIKNIIKLIFSTKLTLSLFIVYSLSLMIATFLEKRYSTSFSKIFIYESTWLEIVMFLMFINLIGNICKYRLWRKTKFPVFIFHLSFIFLFIGGFCSRYLSFEGIMSIREGEIKRNISSQKSYMKIKIKHGSSSKIYYDPYVLSFHHDQYKKKFYFEGDPIIMKVTRYIPCSEVFISRSNHKDKFVKIVSSTRQGRVEFFIKDGEKMNINGLLFSLNREIPIGVNVFEKNKKLYIKSSFPIKCMNMKNRKVSFLSKGTVNELHIRNLYQIQIQKNLLLYWVIPEGLIYGERKYVPSGNNNNENCPLNAITAMISFHKKEKIRTFLGGKNSLKMSDPFFIDNYQISIGYGSILRSLPFYLRLNKFDMKNYPGSNFPSSFKSYVTIIDKKRNYKKNDSVYMNNVLDYKGYRFFQSGYDPDQKGTHFTVNNDYLGTYFSYTGYFLMVVGMFVTFFWKGTRFHLLKRKLKNITYKKKMLFFIFFFFILINQNLAYSHNNAQSNKISLENLSDVIHIPKRHSDRFSRLLVQDYQGRIKPINTMAIDLLRKIHKKNTIGNLDANQWYISIHQDNFFWSKVPFIKVDKKGGPDFIKKVKANKNYYVSMMDLYQIHPKTSEITFILQEDYQKSFSKDPMERNEYDKAVINLSERLGIIHEIFQGKYICMFPIPNDHNHTWSSWIIPESGKLNYVGISMLNDYLKSLFRSQYEKNWNISDNEIKKIQLYQIKYGKSIIPSDEKISAEIIYNKLNIFYYLCFFYSIIGIIITINSFFHIFFEKRNISLIIYKIFFSILLLLFTIDILALITRWYISGHAPWTNGYESSIFISCLVICIGLFFSKKNQFVLGITPLISSMLLMISHGSMMDPEINNLVPVLKSHWLIIHVATIASSYGFFFTGSLLGFLVLILYILRNYFYHNFYEKIQENIEKLTIINELCITIGIFLLTTGTFFGSIWANNSWGRYWSWDPKETWALISILIYAFILHMRMIPVLHNAFLFNFCSTIAISSIIMTYFGVNYYLSGMHSYAKGDPFSIPKWVYYSTTIFFIVAVFSYYSYRKQESLIKK
ncbi:cytochrome c biogenesis protein [Blattabacterium cuenoti]|uniref:cytochrome c biogenesis protein n=1 Tax=Blattabacterium cuenoti TaxID=1653831 RepID=UPI001CC23417|nr:cytochrome c biogenesis protein CcsA [Blattabacterium cuenoti]